MEAAINKKIQLRRKIALGIALLFHISGLIGILFTPYKEWFIQNTPLNLLLMAVLLVLTHRKSDRNFFLFLIITFVAGMAAEIAGANTGLLFGSYSYANILGYKIFNVPLIIGVNWFIVIYCAGMFTQAYENYMLKKMNERGIVVKGNIKLTSFIIDATFLALIYDWIMEPVAKKLGYWNWEHGVIPRYNYICWIIVSAILLTVFRKLIPAKRNLFAVHLFFIQVLFFLVLRTFL